MKSTSEGVNYPIEFMRIAGVVLITLTHIRHDFTEGAAHFILETLPRYGTLLLSVVSGYLFCMNPYSGKLFQKKAKSLLVPYLIANLAVLLPVAVIYLFGYNYLNRLEFDYTLITEGLLSLHSPPVNPPTYFIRDLFVIFCILGLLQRNYWGLLVIIPLLLFGKLMLRWDIAYLFIAGFVIRKYRIDRANKWLVSSIGLSVFALLVFGMHETYYHRHVIALVFFLNFVTLDFRFVKTGSFTYMVHLYHAPVMVFLYPVLHRLYPQPYFEVVAQFCIAIAVCYMFWMLMKRFGLRVVTGYR